VDINTIAQQDFRYHATRFNEKGVFAGGNTLKDGLERIINLVNVNLPLHVQVM
jgi:hypothetical protein